MKFGYLSLNTASGIHPATLGRELEARGFDSLWVPEHSHIPVASVDQYPGGETLPEGYVHYMNPFVALMAAAGATTSLRLGTAVCQPLEHDLLDLACTTATLDVLSEGRLVLGAGVGWNRDELAHHRPDLPFKKRYSALRDRINALRAAWSRTDSPHEGLFADRPWGRQITGFDGEYDRFDPSWVFPKPAADSIPIALGLAGPLGMQHTASYGDMWLPVDIALVHEGRPDIDGRIAAFRQALEENGRDPDSVPITLVIFGEESEQRFEHFRQLGIQRLVLAPPTFDLHDADATLQRLDALTPYLERFAQP